MQCELYNPPQSDFDFVSCSVSGESTTSSRSSASSVASSSSSSSSSSPSDSTPVCSFLRTNFQASFDASSGFDGIFQWYDRSWTLAPLTDAVFSFSDANETYLDFYVEFLDYTFGLDSPTGGSTEEPATPIARFRAMRDFLAPVVEQDVFWQASNGVPAGSNVAFLAAAEQSCIFLDWRYQDVFNQTYVEPEEGGGDPQDGRMASECAMFFMHTCL